MVRLTTTDSAWQADGDGPLPLLQERYQLDELLGRGSVATVYRATDNVLARAVAIKLLHPNLTAEPRFVEQFLEMERRIGRLFHPNLVTIYDAGLADERCFVVMEYVPGGSLRDRLALGGTPPLHEALRILSQVATALQVLHDESIIHGEIKPSNVLLDEAGNARLTDFGIVRLGTTTGVIKNESLSGTAPYLAPERIEHGQADERSDVYALGVLAFELLVGRRPFEGDNWFMVAAERLRREPDAPSELRPELPEALSQVVLRALARDPDSRYRTAAAFRDALQDFREHPDGLAGLAAARRGLDFGPRPPRRPEPTTPLIMPSVDEAAVLPAAPSRESVATPSTADRAVPAGAVYTMPAGAARPVPAGAARVAQAPTQPLPRASLADRLRARNPLALIGLVGAGLLLLLVLGLGLPRLMQPPHPVVVPTLTGRSVDDARAAAKQADLSVKTADEPSDSAPPGAVLRQDPGPSATIQSNQPVTLVVSSGPPPVQVPNLQQRRVDDARQDLAALGLQLGKVEQRDVSGQPAGTIVQQSTKPGDSLARGGTVDVIVALPPRVAAPTLVDKALSAADEELDKRGLHLGEVKLQPTAGKRAGTVLSQDPAPDVQLRQGETVSVTIAVPAR